MYIRVNTLFKPFEKWLAVIIFLFFLFGFVLQSIDWFRSTPGEFGDTRLNSYFLEHGWLWLKGSLTNIWSPPFFYPFKNLLGFSDNFFGSFIFYSFFRALEFPRAVAFDLWYVVGNILNFLSAYWVLKKFNFSRITSAFAAFVFSGALPNLIADNSAQMIYRFTVPLAWLYFYRGMTEGRLLFFGLCALCIAEQFLCSIYLGVFLAYLLLCTMLAIIFTGSSHINFLCKRSNRLIDFFSFLMIALSIAIIGFLLYKYYLISHQYDLKRSIEDVAAMLPKLSSYFLSDRSFISASWSQNLGWFNQRQEHQLFIGAGVMFLFVFGGWQCYFSSLPLSCLRLGRIALISCALVILLTIQIEGYSLYKLALFLPGVDAIRAVGRIILVILFPMAIVIAIGIESIYKKINILAPPTQVIIFSLLLIFISLEPLLANRVRTPLGIWQDRLTRLQNLMPQIVHKDAVLFLARNGLEPPLFGELDAMLLAQDLDLSTINGYSGSSPPYYPDFGGSIDERLASFVRFQTPPLIGLESIDQIKKRVVTIKNSGAWLMQNAPRVYLNTNIQFTSTSPGNQLFLVEGWALPEPWGTWSLGYFSEIVLPLPMGLSTQLVISMRHFINADHPKLSYSYTVDNQPSKQLEIGLTPISSLAIPITAAMREKGFVSIRFNFENPISPKALNIGEDSRVLAFGIQSAIFH